MWRSVRAMQEASGQPEPEQGTGMHRLVKDSNSRGASWVRRGLSLAATVALTSSAFAMSVQEFRNQLGHELGRPVQEVEGIKAGDVLTEGHLVAIASTLGVKLATQSPGRAVSDRMANVARGLLASHARESQAQFGNRPSFPPVPPWVPPNWDPHLPEASPKTPLSDHWRGGER